MTDESVLAWISNNREHIRTPLYLYTDAGLRLAARRLATLVPPGTHLFYSLKANPQPGVVERFAALGIRPEVASTGERRMCALAGVRPRDIVVGGVSKSVASFAEVCESGCHCIVIDSVAEWVRLKSVMRDHPAPAVLLRIAPGVALGGLDMAGASQFGLSEDQAVEVAQDCAATGARFLGLHFYFGSQRLKPEPIVETVRIAAERVITLRKRGLPIRVVDVGLGCGVRCFEKDPELDYESLAGLLREQWQHPAWQGIELWSEAGRALVASCGYFVARVTETKNLHRKSFAFLDGGLNAHNPGIGLGRLFRSNPRFRFIAGSSGGLTPVDLVGNLCTSADRIGQDVAAPPLAAGDLVVIPDSGAYTQTTAMWGFNSQPGFSEAILERDGTLTPLVAQYQAWLQAAAPGNYA